LSHAESFLENRACAEMLNYMKSMIPFVSLAFLPMCKVFHNIFFHVVILHLEKYFPACDNSVFALVAKTSCVFQSEFWNCMQIK